MIEAINKPITFELEILSKPEKLLKTKSYHNILENLVLSDVKLEKTPDIEFLESYAPKAEQEEREKWKELDKAFPYNIVAKSKIEKPLVEMGYHAFFNGMHKAYAEHRPFVLSPDMIWLLISQGFARHVKNNAESLREQFVNFDKKITLTVRDDRITLDNPDSPWEEVFPEFTNKIAEFTGTELINTLSADFSTTGSIEKVASEITIMEAMKSYFEFHVYYCICGIPQITLEGTIDDWKKIYDKTLKLGKYQLDWWIDKLLPILKEFVNVFEGKIDKVFWRNMFKYHTPDEYGAPDLIDGWITSFFPYEKSGKRTKLPISREIAGELELEPEIVKLNIEYSKIEPGGDSETTPLELWAGFVGLEQDNKTMALKPRIGWMIRKEDVQNKAIKLKLDEADDGMPIAISVTDIPREILELKALKSMDIYFLNGIKIPKEMSRIQIDQLALYGKVGFFEEYKIQKLFPKTYLEINSTIYDGPVKSAFLRFLIGKTKRLIRWIRWRN